jgi:hypothetical protein
MSFAMMLTPTILKESNGLVDVQVGYVSYEAGRAHHY